MDREVVMLHLRQAYGGTPGERRAVARAATDLAAAELVDRDRGEELTPDLILEELADAPDTAEGPADRWNWWIGAMTIAHSDEYRRFRVERWAEE